MPSTIEDSEPLSEEPTRGTARNPGQRRRNDLIGLRIGQVFAAARIVADARGARDEYDKIFTHCLEGNPRAVQMLLTAAHRWAKRRPIPTDVAAALNQIGERAGHLGDLPQWLSMAVRARIITAEAAARVAPESESR